MLIEKLADGVLQVETPIGARFIRPNFLERVYLLWIFRNFDSLPQQVLGERQQRLIDRLCSEQEFVPMALVGGFDKPILGRIEKRLPVQPEVLPMRRPVAAAKSPMPERGREAASA
jgi:hypothetical protein